MRRITAVALLGAAQCLLLAESWVFLPQRCIGASSYRQGREKRTGPHHAKRGSEEEESAPGGWFQQATKILQRPLQLSDERRSQLNLFGAACAGVFIGLAISTGSSTTEFARSVDLFSQALFELQAEYVEPVAVKSLTEAAISGMLGTLDPYTEFEDADAAGNLRESVAGRYAGVGLVIAGERNPSELPAGLPEVPEVLPPAATLPLLPDADAKVGPQSKQGSVVVVAAFEGYAFDAGVRVGDRILKVDGQDVTGLPIGKVRDMLRGPADTKVDVVLQRDVPSKEEGIIQTSLNRRVVALSDVKLRALLGPHADGVGYIQLSGFSTSAGRDLQAAYALLDTRAPEGLRALVLDLRSNPGGLLESAVDVAALLLPHGSDIVSARGRSFDSVLYRSAQQPMLAPGTRLVLLTDSGTASAAEIVAGSVQDLDVGVIVGKGEGLTYGKGLVQKVSDLPNGDALKLTIAKYYTPAGRCIQNFNYKNGARSDAASTAGRGPGRGGTGGFQAKRIRDADRKEFRTKHGRVVRDGGGIEADVKVADKAPSPLEIALQVQGAYFDYAGRFASRHEFTDIDVVTPATMADFRRYVMEQQQQGKLKLGFLYQDELQALEKALSATGLQSVGNQVKPLGDAIVREMMKDFDGRADAIKARLEVAILSRYLPESMILERVLKTDPQVQRAFQIANDQKTYEAILRAPSQQPSLGELAYGPL